MNREEPTPYFLPDPLNLRLLLFREQPFFVPDQVIVTGPKDVIGDVLADVQELFEFSIPNGELALAPVLGRQLELTYLSEPDPCSSLISPSGRACDVIIQLYKVTGYIDPPEGPRFRRFPGVPGLDLRDLEIEKASIGAIAAALINWKGKSRSVFADLVYQTGHSWIHGVPYEPAASPWEVCVRPLWDLSIPPPEQDLAEAGDKFAKQWAFGGGSGINLIRHEQDDTYSRSTPYTGQGVRIGVFDTSPFSTEGEHSLHWLESTLVPEISPELPLKVVHPSFSAPWPEPPSTQEALPILNEHGLAVAGLACTVAPASQVYLYRVLDEYLQGDLFTLNAALHEFISGVIEDREELAGAVINLSLGGHTIPNLFLLEMINEGDLWRFGLTRNMLPASAKSLDLLLSAARCHDIVVVAASGNNSTLVRERAAQVPASFSEVLAVAASDYEKNRSCFSNRGQVFAPGGSGKDGGTAETSCMPVLETCDDDCWRYALLAPIWNDNNPSFAYWSGTSFATPLVSGLAALVLEAHPWQDPDDLFQEIQGDASDGIIDVDNTLPLPE
jgi:hypothetical protein